MSEESLVKIRALANLAEKRGQSLAQMALAWVLRRKEVTSVLIGASSTQQLADNIAALKYLEFEQAELDEIDKILNETAAGGMA